MEIISSKQEEFKATALMPMQADERSHNIGVFVPK